MLRLVMLYFEMLQFSSINVAIKKFMDCNKQAIRGKM